MYVYMIHHILHIYIYACIHTCMHACMNHILMYRHIYIYLYTYYTHVSVCVCVCVAVDLQVDDSSHLPSDEDAAVSGSHGVLRLKLGVLFAFCSLKRSDIVLGRFRES